MKRSNDRTIDEYLETLDADKRRALQKLRATIRAAAPRAEEGFSYGLPAFRLNGKPLVAFGASARHCAFHPMDGTTVAAFKDELAGYETSKGTIRFAPSKPLPATLVRKIVKARIADVTSKPRKRSVGTRTTASHRSVVTSSRKSTP